MEAIKDFSNIFKIGENHIRYYSYSFLNNNNSYTFVCIGYIINKGSEDMKVWITFDCAFNVCESTNDNSSKTLHRIAYYRLAKSLGYDVSAIRGKIFEKSNINREQEHLNSLVGNMMIHGKKPNKKTVRRLEYVTKFMNDALGVIDNKSYFGKFEHIESTIENLHDDFVKAISNLENAPKSFSKE